MEWTRRQRQPCKCFPSPLAGPPLSPSTYMDVLMHDQADNTHARIRTTRQIFPFPHTIKLLEQGESGPSSDQRRGKTRSCNSTLTTTKMEKHGLVKVTTVVVEPDSSEGMGSESVGADLRELTQATLPPHLRFWPTEMPFCNTQDQPPFADVCFMVDGHPFMCHKMFFCPRSEYFKALLRDHFHETEWRDSHDSRIPVVTLHNISAEVFAILVHYLYCNQTIVNMENSMDVMVAADMLLVPGLKRQCGVYLGTQLHTDNVIIILRLSRMFQLPRLGDQCVAFMAKNLDQILEQQEFRDLVLADAQEVQGRQETDTVEIVDELRYHISSAVQTISGIHEARTKLSSLEALLDDLGIEA